MFSFEELMIPWPMQKRFASFCAVFAARLTLFPLTRIRVAPISDLMIARSKYLNSSFVLTAYRSISAVPEGMTFKPPAGNCKAKNFTIDNGKLH